MLVVLSMTPDTANPKVLILKAPSLISDISAGAYIFVYIQQLIMPTPETRKNKKRSCTAVFHAENTPLQTTNILNRALLNRIYHCQWWCGLIQLRRGFIGYQRRYGCVQRDGYIVRSQRGRSSQTREFDLTRPCASSSFNFSSTELYWVLTRPPSLLLGYHGSTHLHCTAVVDAAVIPFYR